jgi:hypothetical protein
MDFQTIIKPSQVPSMMPAVYGADAGMITRAGIVA